MVYLSVVFTSGAGPGGPHGVNHKKPVLVTLCTSAVTLSTTTVRVCWIVRVAVQDPK